MKQKILIVFLIALTLSACGWHLRDQNILPEKLQHVHIESKNSIT